MKRTGHQFIELSLEHRIIVDHSSAHGDPSLETIHNSARKCESSGRKGRGSMADQIGIGPELDRGRLSGRKLSTLLEDLNEKTKSSC